MKKIMIDMFLLAMGKIRRFYYHKFSKAHILRNHKRREGECARCGTCCKLLFKCPFLDESQTPSLCKIHNSRPMNCRIFPVDELDMRDRDIVSKDTKCGYTFKKK